MTFPWETSEGAVRVELIGTLVATTFLCRVETDNRGKREVPSDLSR